MKSKMMLKTILVIVGMLIVNSVAGSFTDSRDGQTYRTVKIGDQIWMAENLNYKVNDGKQSWCYDNKESNCKKYGRLYTRAAAKKVCPSGWHLPSKEEFEILLLEVGSSGTERSANLRASPWENGQDKFGFSALPAGGYLRLLKKPEFVDLGYYARFWSSTKIGEGSAYRLDVNDDNANFDYDVYYGVSVRCLKDSNEEREASLARPSGAGAATAQNLGTMKDSRDGKTYKTVKIGNRIWMAENLNYKVNDGKQSWCYDNKESNCKKFGRLYTWAAAKKVCPSGWHLPSKEEFEILLLKVGSSDRERSANLRASSWEEGKDKYKFSALPAGDYGSSYKKFSFLGNGASFWSSTEDNEGSAYGLYVQAYNSNASVGRGYKSDALSVRCLKDN